jgi:hypothetical protein
VPFDARGMDFDFEQKALKTKESYKGFFRIPEKYFQNLTEPGSDSEIERKRKYLEYHAIG